MRWRVSCPHPNYMTENVLNRLPRRLTVHDLDTISRRELVGGDGGELLRPRKVGGDVAQEVVGDVKDDNGAEHLGGGGVRLFSRADLAQVFRAYLDETQFPIFAFNFHDSVPHS